MLTHPTLSKLEQMRLSGMATAVSNQLETPDIAVMSSMDRLGLKADHEEAIREDRRLVRRLKMACCTSRPVRPIWTVVRLVDWASD